MPYVPIVPKGQHLGNSHEVNGAVVGHLFDNATNELKGHAAWRWVDEPETAYSPNYPPEPPHQLTPEQQELANLLSELISVCIMVAFEAAKPHIQRWWSETAVPAVKLGWKRVSHLRRAEHSAVDAEPSSVSRAAFVASTTGVERVVAESTIRMSSAEWNQRFRAMVAAGAFKDEQQRILSAARIDDDNAALDAPGTTEQLTPRQFADRIRRMLEANPALLDDETSAELMRVISARSTPPGSERKPELES